MDEPRSVWRQWLDSAFRHGSDDTPRNRVLQVSSNVFLHLHATKVRRHALRLRYSWGMGGLSFYLFLLTILTGVVLMFFYRPTAAAAYADMLDLAHEVPFGMFTRNLHRWTADLMVIFVWFHMLRVFLAGAYKAPREFNWVVGVICLVLTMLLSFTGYLLPWDQLALWAITVGTNMAAAVPFVGHEGPFAVGVDERSDVRALLLGGPAVGDAALLRFYVLHCLFLPLFLAVLLAVHFWRVRRDGFSGPGS